MFFIARLFRCGLRLLLQPCPSARPGVARARRLRMRNAEAPPEGPLLQGMRCGVPCWDALRARGAAPLRKPKKKTAYQEERCDDNSPASRPVKRAPAGASA